MSKKIQIRFENIGEPFELKFVEVEVDGRSVNCGEWAQDANGDMLLELSVEDIRKATE